MNMSILKKSRKSLEGGDIFVYQIKSLDDRYFFGRVIRTDAIIGGFNDTVLIYLYKNTSPEKNVIPDLSRKALLIPPIATNTRPWTMGYFEVVSSSLLLPNDILVQHCFKDSLRNRYYDADGNLLEKAVLPIGTYGLHSFKTIDDAISKALNIPLALE